MKDSTTKHNALKFVHTVFLGYCIQYIKPKQIFNQKQQQQQQQQRKGYMQNFSITHNVINYEKPKPRRNKTVVF